MTCSIVFLLSVSKTKLVIILIVGVFTRESMKNYRALEAYKTFFLSGWVRTVFHMVVQNSNNFVLKADVMPSQH